MSVTVNGETKVVTVEIQGIQGIKGEQGDAGFTEFKNLTDTPNNYVAGKILKVNNAANAIEFADDINATNLSYTASTRVLASDTGSNATIPLVNTSNPGLLSASDKSKLDGIEANSKDDQTGAEIKALYEAESDTNAYTDTEKSKLTAIEDNATGDQTGAEIKTAYEAESNTNAYTDAEKSKLAAIEASADVTDATNVDAAGAVMNSDSTTAGMGFVIDEDNMASDSSTKVPTQQSVKAYFDANSSDTTYTAGTGLSLTGTTFNVDQIALTTVQTAANESAQLALTTQEGDIVVRSDENKSYVKNSGTAGTMADFTELLTPTDQVLSVAGNTGAVTAAQIAAAVEAASNSNTFTDADHNKLNSCENNSKDDQTGSEIKALYEAESNTNAYTDAEKSKLNTIQTGATADQTAAEIRTLVDSASDSNVFTDADHTKLNAIEASATADQTASEIKTLLQSDKLTVSEIADDSITTDKLANSINTEIAANTAKNTNVSTNISIFRNSTRVDVNSSDGSDGTINEATSTEAGVMTSAMHDKLDGIAAGAEVNVNADWNSSSGDSQILNKPTLFSGSYNDLSNQPTIPTNNNQLTNGANFIDGSALNANNLNSGTIPDARFPSVLPAISGANLTNLPSGNTDKITEGNTEAEVVDTGSGGYFKVTTEGTERFRINSFGAATFTNDFTVDTNTFKVNSSNNRVGVNISNPSDTFDVYNSTNNSRVLRISHPADAANAAGWFGWNSDGSGTTNNIFTIGVQYSSSYYNVLNIKRSTQSVGINNANPAQALDVTGNIIASGYLAGISTSSVPSLEAKGDGSSQDGYIQLNCSQNSHGIKLKSPPHSAGASYTLTFPNTDGNANQVLKSNGSGVLDWVDQTAAYTNASVDAHLNQSNPTSGYVLSWNGSDYSWVAQSSGGGGSMSNLVEDSTPQLGGNLDMQANNITGTGTITANSVANSANGMRKITTSTSTPSGGSDGDIWVKYTA